MQLIDTHCHIHSPEFFSEADAETVFNKAVKSGVDKMILVGTSLEDSKDALKFAHSHAAHCWVSVGIHPHEGSKLTEQAAADQLSEIALLAADPKTVGIGETGFDFYYNDPNESLKIQEQLLRGQIEIALQRDLPLSFHVREAFNDFWRVFESYSSIRGVLHSFTDTADNAKRALKNDLLFGINGIATFTTHTWQTDLFKSLPLSKIVLETDAPFLTPKPKRGSINSPENVIYITEYLASIRGESKEEIAKATTSSALEIFNLI